MLDLMDLKNVRLSTHNGIFGCINKESVLHELRHIPQT